MGLESRLTADGATKPNTTLQPQLTQTWQFLFNTAADTNLFPAKQTLNEADPDLSFYPNERLQWRFTSYVILGFRRYEILWNLQTDSINEKEKRSYMRARAHTHTRARLIHMYHVHANIRRTYHTCPPIYTVFRLYSQDPIVYITQKVKSNLRLGEMRSIK
jgi:hypothetical protein